MTLAGRASRPSVFTIREDRALKSPLVPERRSWLTLDDR